MMDDFKLKRIQVISEERPERIYHLKVHLADKNKTGNGIIHL
jgi:hypothetical protein